MSKSVKGAARAALREDTKLRKARDEVIAKRTADSVENFAAALGMTASNLISQTTYGFNPITRVRTMLEWIHRGSWLGGVAIDLVADDMTRAGVDIKGDIDPSDTEEIEEANVYYGVWNSINECIKWGRLYGGCIGVYGTQ